MSHAAPAPSTPSRGSSVPGAPPASRDRPLPSDPEEIHQVIRAQQNQLASSVDALVDRLAPKNVAARTVEGLKVRARAAVLTEDGQPRTERIVAVGGSVLALVGLFVAGRVRRSRKARADDRLDARVAKAAAKGAKRR